ncbi:Aste57867_16168 [Aphanomyces stellatus]|uniref:Aste57867_16168 protein n=1 Tax=Aphanomyces stellatus TaxID=120398 RepID=A0A485L655_9STRA|nr:hypothetical protein As57867_016112 [Aphanomyces stellatus]VFT92946.1 Aste57867_16168 [Aphanomyces stellatus]
MLLDIFVGGKKNGKVVKDYHSMFNHDYFVKWFGNLMDEVEELGWSSAVFVMDNASYHKGKPSNTPKGNWKKEALVQACAEYNIDDISPNDLKATIWARLKQHIDQNVAPVVADMARARGHHVVYAAPGFSELQPIEKVWANVKGTVGRAYNSDTTFKDVLCRLQDAFFHLDTETIYKTIENSTKKLLALDKALRTAEASGARTSEPEQSESDENLDSSSSSDDGISDTNDL